MANSQQISLLTLHLRHSEDIVNARQRARQIANLIGFDAQAQSRLATAVSEIARNAYRYASGGKVEYLINNTLINPSLTIFISDKGSGINNLDNILGGNYVSKTGMGAGIVGAKRIMDDFAIETAAGQGTKVWLTLNFPKLTRVLTTQTLANITSELAKYRPNDAAEAIQQQNQELLHALEQLSKAREELEERVKERTQQLVETNNQLQQEMREHEQAEEWIRQHQHLLAGVERINSMGEMASALAHELNQPLASIVSFTQGCVRRLETGNYQMADLLYAMKESAQQAERAGSIIHRMKNFARQGKLQLEQVNINTLIQEGLLLINKQVIDNQVTIQLDLNHELPDLQLDKIQIEQVLINIVRNALDAMRPIDNLPRKEIYIKTRMKAEDCIQINIKDTGPGISSEALDQLFDPYFTTKPDGMGLGLAICRTIIEAHQGRLTVNNNSDYGACFTILLPIVRDNK